ncbi:biopolymer transporter ExbD [uncultured Sphingomonas sp.]|uniref:ExbD/TolR family protein n=1 Tax=uncultured Sphingomonas sp. TaxID=158754 RepID=UPI0025DBFB18|nr:biopolymer transporter ExbD [uncultured Sphingomonas sp.]
MMEMNTTPLIDVMLVLLVMLIITIPMQSHAVKLDLPGGPPPASIDPVKNRLAITAHGALLWNGKAVSKPDLHVLLEASAANRSEPELHLLPSAEAPYAAVDEVLAMAKRADVTRMGFVGNEAYARF